MILGIDATNIKSDGGLVHLFEILNKHSEVVLETSQKIMCKYKMHLQSVK